MDTKCRTIRDAGTANTDGAIRYRIGLAVFTAACWTPLIVAVSLEPNPNGLGTHTQLGQPACGFYERTGYPCPTCGMTTAFAHTVRGQFLRALAVQPAGALAAWLCTAGAVGGLYLTMTARRVEPYLLRIPWTQCLLITAAIVLASWGWLCLLTYMHNH